jgi:hypothetical protein
MGGGDTEREEGRGIEFIKYKVRGPISDLW